MNTEENFKNAETKPDGYTLLGKVILFLESLKRKHYINYDDCWYSCPASGECCNDDLDECNCGADDFNKKINDKISELKSYVA